MLGGGVGGNVQSPLVTHHRTDVDDLSASSFEHRHGSLLRQIECPIHGVRVIRLPNHRFRVELSEEVKPMRDASGQIDIQGTMQAVTAVVEGWIREYPDQWLWLHRRWR